MIKSFSRPVLLVSVLPLLLNCASSPERQQTTQVQNVDAPVPAPQVLVQDDENSELFSQIERLIANNQLLGARQIIAQLPDLPRPPSQASIDWLTAQTYMAEQNTLEAFDSLDGIDWQQLANYQQKDFLNTQAQRFASRDPVKAAGFLISAMSLSTQADAEQVNQIWSLLNRTPLYSLNDVLDANGESAPAWTELLYLCREYGLSANAFNQQLLRWQSTYRGHPLEQHLPTNLQSYHTEAYAPHKIAVLLPLSGNRRNLGMAIRDGIISAETQHPLSSIVFIDSEKADWQNLNSQLEQQQVEFVIGPLLKSNIQRYVSNVRSDLPVLFLNESASPQRFSQQYEFALNPEAEVSQAAAALIHKGYTTPIVLAPDSDFGRRLADSFVTTWSQHKTDQNPPQVTYFTNSKSMELSIRDQLDVSQSLARIKSLKLLVTDKVDSDSRNRRDVDMMYVIANPVQSRMVKPFVDVNISPFADMLPVYASSRSYAYSENGNEIRDLNGLTFTDMPWILQASGEIDYQQMQKDIWPRRDTNQFRLFAMGHDAWQLIDKLAQMQHVGQHSFNGLTGEIFVDSNGKVHRQLDWGRVSNRKVQAVEMD